MTSERARNSANHARTEPTRKVLTSRRVAAAALAGLVLASAGGLGYLFLGDSGADSRTVAIVNTDAGATVDGKPVRASDTLIEKLEANEAFDWQVVDADAAAGGDWFATVTVPEDFSEAVSSVWGAKPCSSNP